MSEILIKAYQQAYLDACRANNIWVASGMPQEGPIRDAELAAYEKVAIIRRKLFEEVGEDRVKDIAIMIMIKNIQPF
jgi:hypothetical protein